MNMGLIILAIWVLGVALVLTGSKGSQKRFKRTAKRFSLYSIKKREELEKDEISNLMYEAGLPFNLWHYQILRLSIIAFWLMLIVFEGVKTGSLPNGLSVMTAIGLYVISMPKDQIMGKASPFKKLIDISQSEKRKSYNKELYLATSQLKNMFLVKKDNPPSSDMILEQILKYSKKTKPIFQRMMSLWYLGEKEKAVEYFSKAIGTKEGVKLGQVFMKLDDMNPIELKQQLEIYQEIYRSERETNKLKENEHKSNFLYLSVVVTSMIFILNFIVVVYFIDWLDQYKNFMGV